MGRYSSEQLAWLIRRHGIEMTHLSGGGHIGAILSVADIVAVLYSDVLKYRPEEPKWSGRDRFILSKGHAGAAIYAALAEEGFFPVEELKTHYANGSRLSGHVSHHLPGVDFSTGSLGHGLSAACGMAYAAKKDRKLNHRVFVVLGDGECNEGSVWEAALFANHFRLNNLVVIIDRNHMQSLDFTENTLEIEDLGAKWRAFGWNVIEINGNNHNELKMAFKEAADMSDMADIAEMSEIKVAPVTSVVSSTTANLANPANPSTPVAPSHKPTVIIANTIKGYGVSFMQNDILWHYRFPHDGWEYDTAVSELYSNKPEGVTDPYTPDGISNPTRPDEHDDIYNDHTLSFTWKPQYPEPMRRVEAKSGTGEAVYSLIKADAKDSTDVADAENTEDTENTECVGCKIVVDRADRTDCAGGLQV